MIRENGHNSFVPFLVSVVQKIEILTLCYFVISSATILAFVCGTSLGWSSPVKKELQSVNQTSYDFLVTDADLSWIGSSLTLSKQFLLLLFSSKQWSIFEICQRFPQKIYINVNVEE